MSDRSCKSCVFSEISYPSGERKERGYIAPCLRCSRPGHDHFVPIPTAPVYWAVYTSCGNLVSRHWCTRAGIDGPTFSTRDEAEKAVLKLKYVGFRLNRLYALPCFIGVPYDYSKELRRQEALRKLDDEDRKILGL